MLKFILCASKYLVKGMSSNVNIKGFPAGALSLVFIPLLQSEAKGLPFFHVTVPLSGSVQQSRVIIKYGLAPSWAHLEGISKPKTSRDQTNVFNR
jgi:hypothetical protein